MFVMHGVNDTLVPVAVARHFVAELRRVSEAPVAYVELPRAQHAFDVLASIRCRHTTMGAVRFLEGMRARAGHRMPRPVPASGFLTGPGLKCWTHRRVSDVESHIHISVMLPRRRSVPPDVAKTEIKGEPWVLHRGRRAWPRWGWSLVVAADRGGLQLHQLDVDDDDIGRRRRASDDHRTVPVQRLQRPHRHHRHQHQGRQCLHPGHRWPVQGGAGRDPRPTPTTSTRTGGVNGRKIVVDSADDQYTGTGNKQATQNAVSTDAALVGGFSTFDSFGGTVLAQNPGVPDVTQVLDPATNDLPNVYSAVPLEGGWQEGALQYFKKKFGSAPLQHVGTLVGRPPLARGRLGR